MVWQTWLWGQWHAGGACACRLEIEDSLHHSNLRFSRVTMRSQRAWTVYKSGEDKACERPTAYLGVVCELVHDRRPQQVSVEPNIHSPLRATDRHALPLGVCTSALR